MQTGQPSRTAWGAARHRADHQELDSASIFADPLARTIAGDSEPEPADESARRMRRRMRLFIAARSRFAEDGLADAVAAGTAQAVVLGAGLDTLAYRHDYRALRVFEVDHPDTQSWKRERLATVGIAVPPSVTYVPVDFERQHLTAALAAAEFDRTRPAFVIWLGVTIYLTVGAIGETLAHLGGFAPGSAVVLDYGTPHTEPLDAAMRSAQAEREARLAAIDEQWISRFTPPEIADLLHAAGFRIEADVAAGDLARGYLGLPSVGGPGGRLLRARVTGNPPTAP